MFKHVLPTSSHTNDLHYTFSSTDAFTPTTPSITLPTSPPPVASNSPATEPTTQPPSQSVDNAPPPPCRSFHNIRPPTDLLDYHCYNICFDSHSVYPIHHYPDYYRLSISHAFYLSNII